MGLKNKHGSNGLWLIRIDLNMPSILFNDAQSCQPCRRADVHVAVYIVILNMD
jgi:hypothetical protein